MKNYTIGLDIGTNSVGYAVLTEDYNLVRRRMKINGNTEKKNVKKNFWGVRLFDEGQTAADRRGKRTTRRRLTRRRNRLAYLQEIFTEEMEQVDSNFFHRLADSFLVANDKCNDRHPIFATLEEEVAYHQQFPTIYHLRKELADSNQKADLRLVYLAIAHIIKYRGHFLIEGNLSTENSSVEETFKQFLQQYNQTFSLQASGELVNPIDEKTNIGTTFTEKMSRARKAESVLKMFPGEKSTGTFMQFLKMIAGNQGNFKKVFSLDEEAKLQFPKEDYDELVESLLAQVGDEYADVFGAAKNVYEAVELSGILTVNDKKTKAKLSASMIERFEDHKKDLKQFKKFIRNELPELYQDMFNNEKVDGYAGYLAGRGLKQEDFYKYIKKHIEKVEGAEYFITKIDQENFLRKQRTFDNGVIPHQIHLDELEAILHRQSVYYPFLKESFLKIKRILTFRIPYYVGPLAKGNSNFAWLTRKKEESITPWNLEEVVDLSQSATDFIEKMTNTDQYLPTEKVLPKHSMLYEKYAVYNELTKVSYTDDRGIVQNFSSHEKEKIVKELFKKNRKVNRKLLELFLRNEYNVENPTIQGIEKAFNASYGTYHDFVKLGVEHGLLDATENEEMFEEIIKILTVFEDRQMIREQLNNYADRLSKEALKKLERRHYTGWGRLSGKLLHGIREKQSQKTILDYLMDDDGASKNINRNFMQLINDNNLSFKEEIRKAQSVNDTKGLHEIVDTLAGSPAIKKGILQSLKIVDELVEIMGYAPQTIVVEMARENQTTAKGKGNSKPRYKALEEAIKDFGGNALKDHPTDNKELQNDRLYLYYLQNGKDMYTGEELNIHNLSSYDIDHIIPQSFTTDNSLDNRVLVSSSKNRGKSDDVPSLEVVKSMKGFWERLHRSNLISERKLNRLIKAEKGGLTEEDKAGFIQRQLVETRQITKNVARILDQRYNPEKDETGKTIRHVQIVTLKSALTSQFRKDFGIYKVREINDYHHAHDAYLNGVVANALLKVYPKLAPEFVYGDYRKFNSYKENKATAKKQFYTNLMKFFTRDEPIIDENGEILWDKKAIAMIKKVMGYQQMNIVKKTEIQKGSFSKESILPKGESAKLIARKNGWDTAKYGGFDSPIIAYSVVIFHEKGKKKKRTESIVGITIMEQRTFEKDPIEYLKNKGYLNPQVYLKLPKYTLYELEDGRRRLLASAREAQKGNQMVLPDHLGTLLYHAKRYDEIEGVSSDYIAAHRTEFSELLEHVKTFAEKYTLADKNLQTIIALYEKNSEADSKELAESFINLMVFNAMGAPADFKFFGKTIPRKRYTSISEILDSTVIDQSITGLYETHRKMGE
ncbi:type II CRISPR RNA-guided endonuclease Cas9 [Enterococcus sp. BWM-S5]|uniref:CRISPR-associated endonuclease Cas9 n=1 Tax=Enterococcus larvae TaxID=2794352 RepID=A0ABS4CLN3_9ENTE|nr:type II CRISPR RNA-guided endonuclease Cas9 [Enterococcus larvae]MBP1047383.1 type II CRISPR RNA-guided endonuclease Cas9 [Enterococcus larvae]